METEVMQVELPKIGIVIETLGHYEAIIERGLETFVEVGNALLAIRDGRLYREDGYGTFEDYCRERWSFTSEHARRLMRSAEIVMHLNETPPMGGVLPTNERQTRPLTQLPPDQQLEAWVKAVETAPLNGRVTGAHVQQVVEEIIKERDEPIDQAIDEIVSETRQAVEVTIFSHKSIEYYTPPQYIEAAREVMGHIDLDPASCETAQQWIEAGSFYTEQQDGLSQDWFGHVWLNPPYSKTDGRSNQDMWSQYLIREYEEGNVSEAVLLVKAALGYEWFENLWWNWPTCFARRRLSFIKADGTDDGQSKQATAFIYLGPNVERFKAVFGQFGRVIMPEVE